MATCPSCNRPVAMARPTCVYCGAALPAETVSAVEEATASLRAGANTLRAPMSAAPSGAPAPDRWLLAVDATGRSASDLARFFGLPAYEAQQRERLGGLQLHRVGEEGAVRAEADRLASEGLSVTLVPEAEACTSFVLATGGEQQAGRFRLRTIKPCSYPVPTDGPVGDMLHALHQNPYRPAHLHCMIQAEGYDRLITHVFVEGDAYLDADAVFGVRSSCIGKYVRHEPGVAPDGTRLEVPFYTLDYEFVLQSLA